MRPAGAHDERRHQPPDGSSTWCESWSATFLDRAGDLGGFVRLDVRPATAEAAFSAGLVGSNRRPVVLTDDELRIGSASRLEIRAPGLWTELTVLQPFDHFTVGLEAFGVALDHPADGWGDAFGHRTPLGFDLEWETEGFTWSEPFGYGLGCMVHGEVLVGEGTIELDGLGHRDHRWGEAMPEEATAFRGVDGWSTGPPPASSDIRSWVGFTHGDLSWSYGLCTVRTQPEIVGSFVSPRPSGQRSMMIE